MTTRRTTSIALIALLGVLAAGSVLTLAVGPSKVNAQEEGGTPTSSGVKCIICKALGCPDTSTLSCISTTVDIDAELSAEVKKVLGFTLHIGGTMSVDCYQGDPNNPCEPNPGNSGS